MATEDDPTGAELAELRAELARFVLKEAGAAVADSPDLGLGPALKGVVDAAVRESLEKALRGRKDLDPAAFAERVLRLAEARAGDLPHAPAAAHYDDQPVPACGWAHVLGRNPLGAAAAAIVLLAAVFAAGWFARGQLAPAPAPTAASAAEADPDAVSSGQAAAPSGQPAVLNGVELLSSRPSAQAPAARPRPVAGGRAR